MSADTPSIFDNLSRPSTRARGSNASIPESEDTIRNFKASESVQAAFQASGIPSPPGDVAAIITNHVKSAIQGLPLSQVANMSSGSGELSAAAVAGVNQFVNSLTPSQREAVKAGVNPLDAGAMMKFGSMLNADASNFARLAGRDSAGSGARYDGMGTQNLTQTQIQARDLAIKTGLSWAVNNPDLLRLGPSAIQALADVQFRQESYDGLKRVGYSASDTVGLAKFAKKKNIDANHLAQEIEQSNSDVARKPDGSIDKPILNQLRKIQTDYMDRPDDPAAQKKFDESMKQMKKVHPDKTEHLNRSMKALGRQVQTEQAVKAKDKVVTSANDDLLASINSPAPATTASAPTSAPAAQTAGTATPSSNKTDGAKPKTRQASAAPKPGGVS